ncbi:MAG: GPR endopeptidase [Anaerostipes sp.]|nr:GPR endopeptidase [Anaerostipes sp.]MDD4369645.1 GPR endopeptidase [Anaerostipes sp.]
MNRTDLALELKEELQEKTKLEGVSVKTRIDVKHHLKETKIKIENQKGEELLGKPMGTYVTLETKNLSSNDGAYHKEMSQALYDNLCNFIKKGESILVAGLGNADVTADSLGPKVVNNLWITRHLIKDHTTIGVQKLSAIAPGVMAQTGIETSEILEALVEKTKPDILIVVDALAARSSSRLNKTIQISDTGIAPGSGVGNHRNKITKETVGVPVLAVGVPTVISVPAIIRDIVGEDLVEDLISAVDEEFQTMHVTPKNIDEAVKRISYTISEGINRLLHNHAKSE